MSTHSNIAYRTKENGIFGTYCHFDGYLHGVGAELQAYLANNGADALRARIYQGAMQNGFSSFKKNGGQTYYELRKETGSHIITDETDLHAEQYSYILEYDDTLSAFCKGDRVILLDASISSIHDYSYKE